MNVNVYSDEVHECFHCGRNNLHVVEVWGPAGVVYLCKQALRTYLQAVIDVHKGRREKTPF
jgi:hypothetical protein